MNYAKSKILPNSEAYQSGADHCLPKTNDVMVGNNFEQEDTLFCNLQYTEMLSWMKKRIGVG